MASFRIFSSVTLLLLSTILLAACPHASAALDYDVIVVGGGLSGVNAAYRLVVAHGLSPDRVLLLEARDRTGGRTFSVPEPTFDGTLKRRDLGAEFVSPTQDRLNGYLKRFKIATAKIFQKGKAIFTDHRGEDFTEYSKVAMPFSGREKLNFLRGVAKFAYLCTKINLVDIQHTKNAIVLDNMDLGRWADNVFGPNSPAGEYFQTTMQLAYGSPPVNISMLQLAHFIASIGNMPGLMHSGDRHTIGGTQQVSEGLIREARFHINVSHPVDFISQTGENVTVGVNFNLLDGGSLAPHNAESYKYIGPQRRWITARFVIVAVPLPFFDKIHFEGAVPTERKKLSALSYMADYAKVSISCRTRSWTQRKFLFGGMSWVGPLALYADGSYPSIKQGDPARIVGFFVPPSGDRFTAMPRAQRQAAVMDQLSRELQEPAGNSSFTNGDCHYDERIWGEDPWGKGVTVVLRPGALSQYGGALYTNIRRVYFAGSETAPVWNGYMEGALYSGERAATEVAFRYECDVAHTCKDTKQLKKTMKALEAQLLKFSSNGMRALKIKAGREITKLRAQLGVGATVPGEWDEGDSAPNNPILFPLEDQVQKDLQQAVRWHEDHPEDDVLQGDQGVVVVHTDENDPDSELQVPVEHEDPTAMAADAEDDGEDIRVHEDAGAQLASNVQRVSQTSPASSSSSRSVLQPAH